MASAAIDVFLELESVCGGTGGWFVTGEVERLTDAYRWFYSHSKMRKRKRKEIPLLRQFYAAKVDLKAATSECVELCTACFLWFVYFPTVCSYFLIQRVDELCRSQYNIKCWEHTAKLTMKFCQESWLLFCWSWKEIEKTWIFELIAFVFQA